MSPEPVPGWTPLDLAQSALVAAEAARLHLAVLAGLVAAGLALLRWPVPALALVAVAAGLALGLGPALKSAEPVAGPIAAPGAGAPRAPTLSAAAGVAVGTGAPAHTDLTLVSANIRRDNPRLDEAVAALAALRPDITVLIEADARPGEPLAAALAGPAGAADAGDGGDAGAAGPLGRLTLARYDEWIYIPVLSRAPARLAPRIRFYQRMPARTAVDVELAPGRVLRVVGVHFASPFRQSHRNQRLGHAQFGQVATPPLVAVGDFNAPPWAPEVAEVAEALGAAQVGGWRPSWLPGESALADALRPWAGVAIDHMMVTPSVEVLSVGTAPVPGSDHLAQVARLRVHWPDAGAGETAEEAGAGAGAGAAAAPSHPDDAFAETRAEN
ncbi:MAG: endonuclease/exonuclease/phosphatase family protein [Pseudomonadota bacterium]|nr:endonuclease/exonuclease/phosphatase family protein [Pseudomonadota bacterium]